MCKKLLMKVEIQEKTEGEMLETYPIKGKTTGWFYRTTETSNNAWLVEGSDVWGRKISVRGNDPEALLVEAEKQASNINNEAKNT